MANLMTSRLHLLGDSPQRPSLRPQRDHFADRFLLGRMRDQLPAVGATEPEWNLPAEVSATGLLIGLRLPNALADAVALGLGEGGGDRQEQLTKPIACDVTAQVEQVQFDAPPLQALDVLVRIEGRAEQAIELGRDDDVATLKLGEQLASDRAIFDGDRAGDALLDQHISEGHAVHQGIALDLTALDIKALALVGLLQRRDPAVSVDRHAALQ